MTAVSTGALVPLLPQFLRRARRGNPVLPRLTRATGLCRAALLLLREVAGAPPEGFPTARLRPGAPYATRDTHLGWLDDAAARGFLHASSSGSWRLSPAGQELVVELERGLLDYVASLRPLPAAELTTVADTVAPIAARMDAQLGGPDGFLAAEQRRAALASSDAAMACLERAVRGLWCARDDAHISAWRRAWFNGPSIEILTHLWQGDAEELAALQALVAGRHEAPTVREIVEELVEQGYVERRGDELRPTRAGYLIRETIEAETDRLYFMPWPVLAERELVAVHASLRAAIAALPGE